MCALTHCELMHCKRGATPRKSICYNAKWQNSVLKPGIDQLNAVKIDKSKDINFSTMIKAGHQLLHHRQTDSRGWYFQNHGQRHTMTRRWRGASEPEMEAKVLRDSGSSHLCPHHDYPAVHHSQWCCTEPPPLLASIS